MENFSFLKVDLSESELMEKIYRLRFEVYCRECGFINEEDYPNGLEMDEYDKQAVHFAAFNTDEEIVGTLRLILPGKMNFPIEKHCPQIKIDKNLIPGSITFAEISRLVISKKLRRRKNDFLYYEPQIEDQKVSSDDKNDYLRRNKPMAFGLYREMYQESKRQGITHWYSLMETGLWLLLKTHGFHFECIGEEVDVYGPVKPYRGWVSQIEKEVSQKFPKFFEYFSHELGKVPVKEKRFKFSQTK